MLKNLNVKNFAIIEDLSVNFLEGMTVLTGETGAGKSLIIDTILLLLGARADSDMIRYGTNYASIEGLFSYNNDEINVLLDKYGIPKKEDITIYREIYETSKNVIKVNNTSVSLTILKQIALHLADVHVQNDTFRLFNPDNYLNMINPRNGILLLCRLRCDYRQFYCADGECEHREFGFRLQPPCPKRHRRSPRE